MLLESFAEVANRFLFISVRQDVSWSASTLDLEMRTVATDRISYALVAHPNRIDRINDAQGEALIEILVFKLGARKRKHLLRLGGDERNLWAQAITPR